MFRVIKKFRDLQDNNHIYAVGDTFPRDGVEVRAERIAELSGKRNKLSTPLIKEIPDKPKQSRKNSKKEG